MSQIVRITRKFYAATMKEGDDLQSHLTVMSALAQQLRELGEEVSSQKFATAVLGSLPSSFDGFISSLNARKKEDINQKHLPSGYHKFLFAEALAITTEIIGKH